MAGAGLELVLGSGFKQTVDILWEVDQSRQTGLLAQVLFDRDNEIPEDSDDMSIKETRITLIKSQLNHEIVPGTKLTVTYPINKSDPSITKTDLITADKAMIDGGSIGFVTIFPKQTSQSP
jgi:hypothetical protein